MKNTIMIALLAVATIFTSCGSKTPLTEEQKVYAGKWVANDGTWIQIYNNGGGDFKTSNASVSGGSAVITEDNIAIGILGMETDFSIDTEPYFDEELDAWYMELDGYWYEKQ